MRKSLIFGLLVTFVAGLLTAYVATAASPPNPGGALPCSHGNSDKPCRPDPQPSHGKDCEPHGNGNPGGVNEDHCAGTTTTTTESGGKRKSPVPSARTPTATPNVPIVVARTARPEKPMSPQLSNTGFPLWIVALLGLGLVSGGAWIRRRA